MKRFKSFLPSLFIIDNKIKCFEALQRRPWTPCGVAPPRILIGKETWSRDSNGEWSSSSIAFTRKNTVADPFRQDLMPISHTPYYIAQFQLIFNDFHQFNVVHVPMSAQYLNIIKSKQSQITQYNLNLYIPLFCLGDAAVRCLNKHQTVLGLDYSLSISLNKKKNERRGEKKQT